MKFVTINNIIINVSKIVYLIHDSSGENKVTVVFDNGFENELRLVFLGAEAALVWQKFDTDDWRNEE